MLEHYIDLLEPGAIEELNKYLSYGWRIKYEGTILVILELPESKA